MSGGDVHSPLDSRKPSSSRISLRVPIRRLSSRKRRTASLPRRRASSTVSPQLETSNSGQSLTKLPFSLKIRRVKSMCIVELSHKPEGKESGGRGWLKGGRRGVDRGMKKNLHRIRRPSFRLS